MIVVIEGPDGAGKSTLAERLKVELAYFRGQVKVHHSGRPANSEEVLTNCNYNSDLAYKYPITIVDRTPWISDLVYNDALGREDRLPRQLLEAYHRVPQIVVYCHLGPFGDYKILEGKGHKPSEYLAEVREKHAKIVLAYEEFFDVPRSFIVIEYNRLVDSYSALLSQIGRHL